MAAADSSNPSMQKNRQKEEALSKVHDFWDELLFFVKKC
jgi:hypothetical protein